MPECCENMAIDTALLIKSVTQSTCLACVESLCTLCLKQTLSCSSLIKSDPQWLHLQELKHEARKYFCCMNIDNTTAESLQMEILVHLSPFSNQTGFLFWAAFKSYLQYCTEGACVQGFVSPFQHVLCITLICQEFVI